MKNKIKILEDKNKIIDPWEDYINQDYDNLSRFQKIFRSFFIIIIISSLFIFIIGYLLVKTGQW
jgi:LPS O-antigen subunit length determinant protein (WzzB/FepE family)|tara:strand:- start:2625 stop:2816 length:192 start_codon:yes stop_codon:yes gene_type:complete